MAVVVETTLGDITIDLYTKERPRACLNFLKLCKMKYYNYNLFHTVGRDFIAQTGDPTGSRKGGESVFGVLEGSLKRYFEAETHPRIKHTITGLVSFVGAEDNMIGSQFFITLAPDLTYLDDRHCVFGEVAEGLDVLEILNDAICDTDNRPYQDIRITHTVVLDDPYPDLPKLHIPSRSPSPSAERLQGGRIAPDEEIDETTGKDMQEIEEIKAEREAKARATILEMVGDIPDAEMAPPENVLFVCKLNPVTTDDDLEIIFSRFGKINSCEVIRDRKTGDSLQYAFIEFDESKACEDAYFKMDNVLIDDRRIHVDFSQSVAKVKWLGKGRGVAHFDDKGRRTDDRKNDIGQGNYKGLKRIKEENREKRPTRERPSNDKDRDYEAASRDKERSRRDRQRSSNDRDSPTNQQKSFRDQERSPSDTESPKKQQKFLRERQRSSRDRESPREQQKSLRDRERSPKDRDSPRNQRKYSRDGDSPPRDQQRYSRGQQKSSRAPQGYSRDRQSRDHESSNRYRSPPRSSRRGGYYPEERRERGQYRPYPMQNRRPDRSYNYEEKRKSDYHSARSYEQPRSETSREEYRRPNERRDRAEGSQFKKYSKQQEYSSSEEESSKKILKSKACAKKKSRKTSSSSSSSEDDRKKSQGKSRRQKKKSESDDSSDSSSDSYKKETKRVSKKKKSKYSD